MPSRPDPNDWMWAHACDLIDRAGRMQRQFFRPGASARAGALWEPPVDVFENDHEVVIVVAIPGVVAGDVQVLKEPGVLIVRAHRPAPFSGLRHAVRQLEIPYGRFERRIALPFARLEPFSSELADGCLIVRFNRRD